MRKNEQQLLESPPKQEQDKTLPARFTIQQLVTQLMENFNLERGLPYTLKALLLFPGRAIRMFLFEDRSKLMKPLNFLLLTTAIIVFVTLNFVEKQHTSTFSIPSDHPLSQKAEQLLLNMSTTILDYLNALLILSIPIVSLVTYFVFRQAKLFFAEHLVVNAYIFGFANIISLATLPLLAFGKIFSVVGILFYVYAGNVYIQVFQEKAWFGIGKTILAFFLSQFLTVLMLALCLSILLLFY